MIDVYVANIPSAEPSLPLSCAERQSDIDKISNERARREKYYAWRLLEYAIKNSLGADASRLYFTKGKNRRWSSDTVEFSLSHSSDAVAVVIFNPCNGREKQLVGVDIEGIKVRNIERMADYMLSPAEHIRFESLDSVEREEWLIRRWCEKEAAFKSFDEKIFAPKKIETAELFCESKKIKIGENEYILAVAAKEADEIRVFKGIDF